MAQAEIRASHEEVVPAWWERAATIYVLIMLTGALIGPILAPDPPDETPALRLFWLPVYAVIAALLARRATALVRAWPAVLAVIAMVGVAYASKYWSIDPAATVRRVVAMGITSSFALYLGVAFPGRRLPGVVMDAGLLMAVGSLIFVFALPAYGVHHGVNDGLWRGLWYEKNQMGIVMVGTALAAAAVMAAWPERRRTALVTLGLATVLVLMTQSKTSLLCLAAGLSLIGGLWMARKGGAALAVAGVWGSVVAGALGLFIFTHEPAAVLQALGKDPSLTGRTHIWDAVMRQVESRPMTGFGYNAFWGVDSVPADFVRLESGWPVPSAHNGWLDLLVQMGWPITIGIGALVAAVAVLTVARLGRLGVREGGYALAFLAVFLILSLSESVLLRHQSLPWVLFLAIMTRAFAVRPRVAAPAPARARPRPSPGPRQQALA